MISSPRFQQPLHWRTRQWCVEPYSGGILLKSMLSQTLSQVRLRRSTFSQQCHSLAVLLLLAACTASPPPKSTPAPAPLIVVPTRAPQASPSPHPPAPPRPRLATPSVAIPDLVGMSQAAAVAHLGRPDAVETKGAAQIYVWRAGACSLRVSFFLDVTNNQRLALSQALTTTAANPDLCAQRIASRGNR